MTCPYGQTLNWLNHEIEKSERDSPACAPKVGAAMADFLAVKWRRGLLNLARPARPPHMSGNVFHVKRLGR